MKKAYLLSLGCSRNLVDSEVLLGLLEKKGVSIVDEPEEADVAMINTCGFIQDAKQECGWDEFQAQKFQAWEHHLALTILASWFVAQTKLRWAQQYPRDPKLYQELEVDLLPALSVANVRELLRAVMPLPQLSREQAAEQVVKHLVNRARSRKSRVKKKSSRANHRARDPA